MSFFSFVKRIGNKVADGVHAVASVGKKVTGAVSSVGNKIASYASKGAGIVERIPVLGEALAPVTGIVRAGAGLVQDVADTAGAANKLLSKGDDLVRTGQNALNANDVKGAIGAIKSGGAMAKDAGALVQRSKGIVAKGSKMKQDFSGLNSSASTARLEDDRQKARKSMSFMNFF